MGGALMSGWFAIKRGMLDHPIFHKRPDRTYVWIWMMETAAFQDTRQDASGRPVEVKRGQILTSFRQIEAATGVGVQVIRTLFKLLEGERAINTDTSNGRLLVTICNYDKYQSSKPSSNTPANTAPTQRQHTKETREQIPPSEGASADPAKVIFDGGKRLLAAAGIPASKAGALLGKWRRDHGDDALIAALGRAQREGAIDPVSYLEGCLRFKAKTANHPEIGSIREVGGVRKQYAGNGAGWLVLHE